MKLDQAAASAARSSGAPARTMKGDFPPSSVTHGTSRSPARAATFRPVATEPVNMIPSTRSTSAAPAAPRPVTTWKTSGGFPACRQSSARRTDVSGVTSDGFRTTAFPARSGATASAALFRIGKFQGPMTPTTPSGRRTRRVFFVTKRSGCRVSSRESLPRGPDREADQFAQVEDLDSLGFLARLAALGDERRHELGVVENGVAPALQRLGAPAERQGRPDGSRRPADSTARATPASPSSGSSARSFPVAGETTRKDGAGLSGTASGTRGS